MRTSSSSLPAVIVGVCLATTALTANHQIKISDLTAARGVEARWPAGPYRVDLRVAGAVLAECRFTIATPQARYIHPRVGYAFAPPAGWTIDDSGPDDGVRLRAPDGAGLIEIQTGPASVPLDPVSYAAGWQSVAVGPGKRVEALRASRMYVITGVFEASQFGAGQTLFDAWIASLRVSPASD